MKILGGCITLFITAMILYSSEAKVAMDCLMDEKFENNRCLPCPRCPIGTGLAEPCGFGNGGYLTCKSCPYGFYNTDPDGNLCIQCTKCNLYNRIYKYHCRNVVNAECGDCLPGYYDGSKHLAHREKLYSCTPCTADVCASSVQTNTDPINVDTADNDALPLWKPISYTIVVSVVLLSALLTTILLWKRRRHTRRSSNRSSCWCGPAQICPDSCCRKRRLVFRTRPTSTHDEENLWITPDNCGSGESFIMNDKSLDKPSPEPTDQNQKHGETGDGVPIVMETEMSCNKNRANEQFQLEENRLVCNGTSVLDHNTNTDHMKSLVTKTKVIPVTNGSTEPPTESLPFTSRFWDNNGVCSSSLELGSSLTEQSATRAEPNQADTHGEPHPTIVNEPQDLTPKNINNGSTENVRFASELTLATIENQLNAPSVGADSSVCSHPTHSEASTLLIRDQDPPTRSQPPDALDDAYPRLYLPQQPHMLARYLNTIEEVQSRDNDDGGESVLTMSENQSGSDCSHVENTQENDINEARRNHSIHRRPQNKRTESHGRTQNNIGPTFVTIDNSTDKISAIKINGSTDSKPVNIVNSTGNPASIVLNDGGVSIQVIHYAQTDGVSPRPASSKPKDSSLFRGEGDSSITETISTFDDNQTCVKRPIADESVHRRSQYISAPRGRCRPRGDGSFASVYHYPIQETCDGPSWSLPALK